MKKEKQAQKKQLKQNMFYEKQVEKYGQRYVDYRDVWNTQIGYDTKLDFPLYIHLESIYSCNLSCPSCLHGNLTDDLAVSEFGKPKGSKGAMSMEIFEKILQECKENNLPSINLNWVGEPTLLPDLDKRVAMCREYGIMDIIITTNGQLLNEEKIRSLISSGLTHILFSIDAVNEDTYKIVRPGQGSLAKVIENIEIVKKVRDEIGDGIYPQIRASIVPSVNNQSEITEFVDYFSELVDYVEVQNFHKVYDRMDHLIIPGSKKIDFKCSEVFKTMTISYNGNIHPCCSVHGKKLILGNILTDGLKTSFNNQLLNSLRMDEEKDNITNSHCQECHQSNYKYEVL